MSQRQISSDFSASLAKLATFFDSKDLEPSIQALWSEHVRCAAALLNGYTALDERVRLAAHKIFGKSSEKRTITLTEASSIVGELFSGLLVPDQKKAKSSAETPSKPCVTPATPAASQPEPARLECALIPNQANPSKPDEGATVMETLEPGINETPAANEPARKRDRWQGDWIRDQANVVEVESKNGPIVCNKCGRAECREVPPVERYVLSYIRAHVRVTKVLREVVICRQGCEFFRAPWPESVEAPLIERGAASPSMVAAVMTDHAKYGIPVFTQQQILAEVGVQIPYGALLRYRGQGTDLLRPLYKLMDKLSQTEARILIDDTRYLALRLDASENEKKTINGRMWGKTDNKTFAYFAFAENWKATFLETFLGKFIGVLVGDGYAGYAPYVEKNGLKGLAGCNDHARRKFNESALLHDAKANEVLTIFKTIYHVENEATVNTWCREEIRQNRQELSKPAFEKVRSMLIEAQHSYPAGSTMARAITYFLRNYDRLTYYLDDGDIPISTAALERMIRSIAKIRKNSMFVGSVASGEDLAINLSFMKSCELAGICYFKYLVDVLPKLSGTTFPAQRAEELLPHRWAEIRGLGRYKPVPAAA